MSPEEEIAQRLMEAISAPVDLAPGIRLAIIGTLTRYGAAREAEARAAALRDSEMLLADAKELLEIVADGSGSNTGNKARAKAWLRALATPPEKPR